MTGKIQHKIEGLLSDNSILNSKLRRLENRVHSLEVKIGNTDVEATLNSDAERISQLEKWQDSIENWMRKIDNILDTTIDAKWTCPNCKFEFENLAEFIEHIVANINDLEKKLTQHLEDKTK